MSTGGPEGANQAAAGSLAPYLACRTALVSNRVGDGGLAVCQALTQAMDGCLTALFAPLAITNCALVAVGGYGRGELCLYSDIDVMLLHNGHLPAGAPERLFYPLWDAGLKVGHAVRSVPEACTAAGEHLETLTALLDARLVAGQSVLLDELFSELGKGLQRKRFSLHGPLAETERTKRTREPFQLLEVNLKNGRGGLRTLHALHWERRRSELVAAADTSVVAPEERDARATLLATRNALHAIAGRVHDSYTFDYRPAASAWLGLEPDSLGRRLYLAMRTVDARAADYWALDGPFTAPRRHPEGGLAHEGPHPGFPASPLLAAEAALARPPDSAIFTPDEMAQIRAAHTTSWTAADRAALLRLLATGLRGWEVFQALVALGWVARVLPEWQHVVAAPQYVPFHLHPVDAHLWRTVTELVAITQPASDELWCPEVAQELGVLDEALLAALLHDIGKGWPGDHAVTGAAATATLLRRLGFGAALTTTVTTAVRHHLLLPTVATRRDIADPRVIAQVADQVGDLRTLRILYLLSVADARATGPTVWSAWKASLIRTLYARTTEELTRRLTGTSGRSASEQEHVEELISAATGLFDRETILETIPRMPPGYLATASAADLLDHLVAMVRPPGPDDVVVHVHATAPAVRVLVVATDRPGLLSTITGVFALHNVSVLDGHFYTRNDGVVVDIFHVQDALDNPLEESRWDRLRRDMSRAVHGELALADRLREKAHAYRRTVTAGGSVDVIIEPDPADDTAVVEVHCPDRIGLLHQLARTLFELGLDIWLAKVDTQGGTVVDTFYVRTLDGAPIRGRASLAMLTQAVRERLLAIL